MPCKYRTNLFILLLLCCFLTSYAQETDQPATESPDKEQLGKGKGKNKIPVTDSIRQRFNEARAAVENANNPQTTNTDSISTNRPTAIRYSSDSLSSEVQYEAADSMLYDVAGEKIYLFGTASLAYEDMTLKADIIVFDWGKDIATAYGREDSLGNYMGKPEFIDGEQTFNSDTIRYNYRTNKGKVYNVRTQEGDGYLLSRSVKFDLRSQKDADHNDIAFAKGTLYTTCNAEDPHFGIRSGRAKIIPNKLIVVGGSNVEIEHIPTPLWLPFGFFPLKQGQRSGLIFPRNYEFSPTLGYGFRNVGYYKALNDYMDLQVTGDIYTRGTWGLSASSNYTKRYKYNGGFGLSYSYRKLDIEGVPAHGVQKDFNIRWNHTQAASAHPTRTFSASMNIGTGSYYTNNFNDQQSVLRNDLSSNINLRKRFPGKPYSLTTSFSHTQNIETGSMTINFPQVNFNVSQIRPFERKNKIGKERWYEKIGVTYAAKAENRIQTQDNLLFKKEVLDDMRYGISHTLRPSMSFNVLKYFTVTPSVNYSEKWYFRTLDRTFDDTTRIEREILFEIVDGDTLFNGIAIDTIFGRIIDNNKYGFRSLREISGGISANTTLYGMLPLGKKGAAIRHVMTPNIGINFRPDYEKDFWNYYDGVEFDNRYEDSLRIYSPFDGGLYNVPRGGKQASMSFGISNTLEGKFRNRRDTTNALKKVKLINSFNVSSSYNFVADSLRLSDISMSGNTKLFKVINVRFGAGFAPYSRDKNGKTINVFEWKANKRLARFKGSFINLDTRLDPRKIEEAFKKEQDKDKKSSNNNRGKQFIGSLTFSYGFAITNAFENGKDTIKITRNNVRLSQTRLNLTSKLSMDIGGIGYDFVSKNITYPDFSIYRDLHCWETGISWQPDRRIYSFFLRVKPSSLDFLKIPYSRNNADPFVF